MCLCRREARKSNLKIMREILDGDIKEKQAGELL